MAENIFMPGGIFYKESYERKGDGNFFVIKFLLVNCLDLQLQLKIYFN